MKAVAATAALGVGLRYGARREIDELRPAIADVNDRIEALVDQAWALAIGGREDAGAIEELLAAAGRRPKDLLKAAALVRFREPVTESRLADRANRLLSSAAGRGPITPMTPEQDLWFKQIESVEGAPRAAAFSRLASAAPALLELEAEVRRRAAQPDDATRSVSTSDVNGWWDDLCRRLEFILGPESQAADPLLRTMTAFGVARIYLGELVGVESQEVVYEPVRA